ncbi:Fructosamine kinase-domain-containing protein [Aspergillus egyptiacus]|nr:Fructosamine kinase-domain-containing protein [Aspergillus egyptiacus]
MASTAQTHDPLLSSVSQRLPNPGSRIIDVARHGVSHFGRTLRVTVQLLSGLAVNYFLKVVEGDLGMLTCRGEYESLKEISSFCDHVPEPYAWGRYMENNTEYSFLLVEFLQIQKQPAAPQPLAKALATLHQTSRSPTGKFGFHTPTCHTRNIQSVAFWTDSWSELFTAHLSGILSTASNSTVFASPSFTQLGNIILSTVTPALLDPLQSNGRTLKPCLVHGDCWDMNTAMASDGRAVFFDVASFYAHNEYDVGNWRASRHGLSERSYIDAYKALVPPSEPVDDWDNRNLLYSLPFNLCNALFVPGSTQRNQVFQDMRTQCERVCSEKLHELLHYSENHSGNETEGCSLNGNECNDLKG